MGDGVETNLVRWWRKKRAGGDHNIVSLLIAMATLGVLAIGSWWTAQAVVNGNEVATLFRFGSSCAFGGYYLILGRVARGSKSLT